ncbi:MAG TPA: hypothetical protein VGN22_15060 [Pseudonocardia sp.]
MVVDGNLAHPGCFGQSRRDGDRPDTLIGEFLVHSRLARTVRRATRRRREASRYFYPDWERAAAGVVAGPRMRADGDLDDPRLAELVGELSVKSPEFARLWSRHDVRRKRTQSKIIHHPLVGELMLEVEPLTIDSSPGQQSMVYHADPACRSAQTLALLGSLGEARTVHTAPERTA